MKNLSFAARREWLLNFAAALFVEMLAAALLTSLWTVPGKAGRLVILCLLLLQLLVWGIHYVLYRRKQRDFHTFCQRFIDGEIYQDMLEQMDTWEPAMGGVVRRMDELIERKNVIQLSTRQAEFLALQNQINPHFLYNTLEAIRSDALMIGAEKIADITEALSVFFRYTITNTRNLVTLQEELDNVETYFLIQKYRFEDKLDLEIRFLDDESRLRRMHCPKLSLQPIVENAIFHGIERTKEGGRILIEVEIIDDHYHVSVNDNGRGMSEEQLQKLNEKLYRASVGLVVEEDHKKKGGIALQNVNRRIKLLFGEKYGLVVSSVPGVGTRVEMVLPLEAPEDN